MPVDALSTSLNFVHVSTMGCCGKKRLLTVMTSICASSAFVLLCIGVATDHWLYTIERVDDQDSAPPKKAPANETIIYKRTTSGLWRKCMQDDRKGPKTTCSYIKYFSEVDADELEPTETILRSMRRSTIFPLVGLLMLLIGEIISFVGLCTQKTKVLTFIAGILFVVSGLCVLTGIILYIVSISNEEGSKPKNSNPAEVKFRYKYGSSFLMTITSFILSELGGVLSVYLYISRHKHAYRKKQERLAMLHGNQRPNPGHNRRSRSYSRDSRDRDSMPGESYFTYTPVSDTPNELSNYTLSRDTSRQTMSTTAETHLGRDHLFISRSAENLRRTTPV